MSHRQASANFSQLGFIGFYFRPLDRKFVPSDSIEKGDLIGFAFWYVIVLVRIENGLDEKAKVLFNI